MSDPSPVPALPGDALAPVPLKGEICVQYIKCNKSGCHCQGGEPHGPYHYRVWRDGGRVHKQYVKSADLASVRAACTRYKELDRQLRHLRQLRVRLTHQINREWRSTRKRRWTPLP